MPRPSHVRDAVVSELSAADHHVWSVDEVLEAIQRRGVPADFSSVFRGLQWAEKQGVVQRVELGDGKARFEVAGGHHEHAQCERCGTIAEIPECLVEEATERLQSETGFAIRAHRIVLVGLCPNCQ
ncbi:MAG: transcriptional repressor [Candidatus Dormibacteraeota bacterium]|nr:transcriptional repressor [Candidatus Dormibacteraeota bacterium]